MAEIRFYNGKTHFKHDLIPPTTRASERIQHSNRLGWKLFAGKIQKHPFIKECIIQRDGPRCVWCRGALPPSFCLHHIDYAHECSLLQIVTIETPTEKRPYRITRVPDCEKCSALYPGQFRSCLDRLVATCPGCNHEIAMLSASFQ